MRRNAGRLRHCHRRRGDALSFSTERCGFPANVSGTRKDRRLKMRTQRRLTWTDLRPSVASLTVTRIDELETALLRYWATGRKSVPDVGLNPRSSGYEPVYSIKGTHLADHDDRGPSSYRTQRISTLPQDTSCSVIHPPRAVSSSRWAHAGHPHKDSGVHHVAEMRAAPRRRKCHLAHAEWDSSR